MILYEATPLGIQLPSVRRRGTGNDGHLTPNRLNTPRARQDAPRPCGWFDRVSVFAPCNFSSMSERHSFQVAVSAMAGLHLLRLRDRLFGPSGVSADGLATAKNAAAGLV